MDMNAEDSAKNSGTVERKRDGVRVCGYCDLFDNNKYDKEAMAVWGAFYTNEPLPKAKFIEVAEYSRTLPLTAQMKENSDYIVSYPNADFAVSHSVTFKKQAGVTKHKYNISSIIDGGTLVPYGAIIIKVAKAGKGVELDDVILVDEVAYNSEYQYRQTDSDMRMTLFRSVIDFAMIDPLYSVCIKNGLSRKQVKQAIVNEHTKANLLVNGR